VEGAALSPAAARRARQGLRALIEGESADLPERQSLRWMWNELEYEGGFSVTCRAVVTEAWCRPWPPASMFG
jgi:hypothetical protein